jgi:hypothetical protein
MAFELLPDCGNMIAGSQNGMKCILHTAHSVSGQSSARLN